MGIFRKYSMAGNSESVVWGKFRKCSMGKFRKCSMGKFRKCSVCVCVCGNSESVVCVCVCGGIQKV